MSGLALALVLLSGLAQPDTAVAVGRGDQVVVQHISGEIIVRGWERAELEVVGDDGEAVEVRVTRAGNRLVIGSDDRRGRRNADFTLYVPRWAPVEIVGLELDVRLEGLDAGASVQNVEGDISVRGTAGSLAVTTVDGEVTVESVRAGASESPTRRRGRAARSRRHRMTCGPTSSSRPPTTRRAGLRSPATDTAGSSPWIPTTTMRARTCAACNRGRCVEPGPSLPWGRDCCRRSPGVRRSGPRVCVKARAGLRPAALEKEEGLVHLSECLPEPEPSPCRGCGKPVRYYCEDCERSVVRHADRPRPR